MVEPRVASSVEGWAPSRRTHPGVGRAGSLIKAFVTATIVMSCSGAPPAPATPTAAFGPSDVTRAVEMLASAGVAVRIVPSDAPLVAPVGQSRVNLLRFQVRNLALEAYGRGGSRGSELDEFAVANGGLPVSYLIAAWARTAGTPAATAASEILGDSGTVDPPALRIPGLVTALFLADLLQGPTAQTGRHLVADISGTVAATGFCDEVGVYLTGVLEGMLDPTLALAPAWLQGAIDNYPLLENDPAKLRNAVAATAMLVYATSISRPWLVAMSAAPLAVHYVVDEDELSPATKSVLVSVDSGDGSFADEVNGCAELADAQLADTDVDGSRVTWIAPGIVKHGTDIEGDLEIENGTALFQYQTKVETSEAHKNGTLRSETVVAYAFIEHQDINALTALVERLVGDAGILAPNVRAVYDRVKPQLDSLLVPRGWTVVDVSWHEEPAPTPGPSATGPDDCSADIPAGRYEGSLTYATTGPALTHDSTDGQIRFQVDANGKVSGTWDVAYFVKSGGAQVGTGSVADGTVGGTARLLLLDGTNVVRTSSGSGTSVAWPITPLTVQEVCDGRVVADWVQTVNDVRQQVGVEAMPAP